MTLIIIPTYNERKNIVSLVEIILGFNPEFEVLVVDDNSPDGTADMVKELKNKFPKLSIHQRIGRRGFGSSYLNAFKRILPEERYKTIVMMDADFSHDPEEIPEMVEKLSGSDVVVGSRYIRGGKIENWSWRRRLLSRFANFYARTILGTPIKDMTAGFMCFRKDALKRIDLDLIKSEGYAFLVELKYKMFKAGYKVFEHPIVFTERREGESKMSFKNIWEAVFLPWKLKLSKN